MLPTLDEAILLLRQQGNPKNIIDHSIRVAQVTLELAQELKSIYNIDLKLALLGALLHDVTKMRSIKTGEDHAQTGAFLIEELGYKELAPLIRHHIMLKEPIANPAVTEVELVFYADKRVKHTEVVSIKERFVDVIMRYCPGQRPTPTMIKIYKQTLELEKIIFSNILLNPSDLFGINQKPIDIKEIKRCLED